MRSTTATAPAYDATESRCSVISGPGSTTTERLAPGSRSTQVLVPSSVIMFALGASTQRARSPNSPPDQAPSVIGAILAATSSASRTNRSGMDR